MSTRVFLQVSSAGLKHIRRQSPQYSLETVPGATQQPVQGRPSSGRTSHPGDGRHQWHTDHAALDCELNKTKRFHLKSCENLVVEFWHVCQLINIVNYWETRVKTGIAFGEGVKTQEINLFVCCVGSLKHFSLELKKTPRCFQTYSPCWHFSWWLSCPFRSCITEKQNIETPNQDKTTSAAHCPLFLYFPRISKQDKITSLLLKHILYIKLYSKLCIWKQTLKKPHLKLLV